MYPQDPNYQHFPMQGCDYSKLPYIVDLWHAPSSSVLLEDLWIDHEQFGCLFPLAIFGSGNPWTCLGWVAKHVSSPWHLSREWLWSVCHLAVGQNPVPQMGHCSTWQNQKNDPEGLPSWSFMKIQLNSRIWSDFWHASPAILGLVTYTSQCRKCNFDVSLNTCPPDWKWFLGDPRVRR